MPELLSPLCIALLIIAAVPVQFLLSPSSENFRQFHLHRLMTSCDSLLRKFSAIWIGREEDEQVREEDEAENINKGYFASSLETRHRAPHVKYRVGQVIRHRIHGYRAVICGWDLKARAPDAWIQRMHKGHEDWSALPNYAVLIDTRDHLTPQLAYIVEENIELMQQQRIIHPLVHKYFEHFDGIRYHMRPWIRKTYPHD